MGLKVTKWKEIKKEKKLKKEMNFGFLLKEIKKKEIKERNEIKFY